MSKSSFSEHDLCYCTERQGLIVLRLFSMRKGALTTRYICSGAGKAFTGAGHDLSTAKMGPAGARQRRREAEGAGGGPSAAVASWLTTAGSQTLLTSG